MNSTWIGLKQERVAVENQEKLIHNPVLVIFNKFWQSSLVSDLFDFGLATPGGVGGTSGSSNLCTANNVNFCTQEYCLGTINSTLISTSTLASQYNWTISNGNYFFTNSNPNFTWSLHLPLDNIQSNWLSMMIVVDGPFLFMHK